MEAEVLRHVCCLREVEAVRPMLVPLVPTVAEEIPLLKVAEAELRAK